MAQYLQSINGGADMEEVRNTFLCLARGPPSNTFSSRIYDPFLLCR